MTSEAANKRLKKLQKELREESERHLSDEGYQSALSTACKIRRSYAIASEPRRKKMQHEIKGLRRSLRKPLKQSIPDEHVPTMEAIAFKFVDAQEHGVFYSAHNNGRFIIVRIRQHRFGPLKYPAEYWAFDVNQIIENPDAFAPIETIQAKGIREHTIKAVEELQSRLENWE